MEWNIAHLYTCGISKKLHTISKIYLKTKFYLSSAFDKIISTTGLKNTHDLNEIVWTHQFIAVDSIWICYGILIDNMTHLWYIDQ